MVPFYSTMIDVIIPVYKPKKTLITLLDALQRQTKPAQNIILYNTEKALFEPFERQWKLRERYANVQIFHHTKEEFDHGGTRRLGVSKSDADVFVCMTDDAIPGDDTLLQTLYDGLMQREEVAVCYARQLPAPDCRQIERYTRSFNYPEGSRLKGQQDAKELGIKTYFCSNVCAAYKREIYDKLGGFVAHTIFNEDMIYAGNAVQQGYLIYYAADACVIHSHNYSMRQQFQRNFDLGISQAEHPEIFAALKSESEGSKLVVNTAEYLLKNGHPFEIVRLVFHSAAKLLGYKLGRQYRKLPRRLVCAFAMNKVYVRKYLM